MKLVVDANVFFSAFLRPGLTRRIWLDRRLRLYAPEHLLVEFSKYRRELRQRSGLGKEDCARLLGMLLGRARWVKDEEMLPYAVPAAHLVPDKEDEPYVACALAVGADIWSNDRHLRSGRIRCWTTEELSGSLEIG